MLHIKGIEENHEMQGSILMAFDMSVTTKIHNIISNPPKKEQIFLAKIEQVAE